MIRAVLLLACLCPVAVSAADTRYVCPTEITAAWHVLSAPDGWETFGSQTILHHRLRGATFTDGHPKDQGFLKPYKADTKALKKGLRKDVYQFSATYPHGIWLVCSYQNTPAIVFTRLPDTLTSCEVSSSVHAAHAPVQTIRCQ
jgi:hypothetical protein